MNYATFPCLLTVSHSIFSTTKIGKKVSHDRILKAVSEQYTRVYNEVHQLL